MKKIITMCLVALVGYAHAQTTNTINNQSKNNNMENEAKKVVTEFLTAVQKGDTQKLAALMHPDVEWSQPGNNQLSGIKRSRAEVFQMVGKMYELSYSTLVLTSIKSIGVNGNSVACLIHWNAGQPSGRILDIDNIDVYTVENGQITKVNIFTTDAEKEDKFWGE